MKICTFEEIDLALTEDFAIAAPTLEGLLREFLRFYKQNKKIKDHPILLTFDDEDWAQITAKTPLFYRGADEMEHEFHFRMMKQVTDRVNLDCKLIGGFFPVHVGEIKDEVLLPTRKIGIAYYHFPTRTNGEKGGSYHTLIKPAGSDKDRIVKVPY